VERDGAKCAADLGWRRKYFFEKDWTTQISLIWFRNLDFTCMRVLRREPGERRDLEKFEIIFPLTAASQCRGRANQQVTRMGAAVGLAID
jgi:hypothetical protein